MKAAWLGVAVAVVFVSGCAKQDWIDRTLVTVDVTGTWRSTSGWEFNLEQEGLRVTGSVRPSSGASQYWLQPGPIRGSVAGDVFRFTDSRDYLEGEVTVSGDEMNGTARLRGSQEPIYLRRVDPSSPPASPPR